VWAEETKRGEKDGKGGDFAEAESEEKVAVMWLA
jgi:hypothetical protein